MEAKRPGPSSPSSERRGQLIAIAILALLLIGVLIFVSQSGNDSQQSAAEAGRSTKQLLSELPQKGTRLGQPDAPVTVTEFGDPQCPFCAQFADDVLPSVIEDYVANGDVQLDFQPLSFIGPDSVTAGRVAAALIPTGKYWNFIDLFYKQQKPENSGYVTDAYLTSLLQEIPGVDPAKILKQAKLPATDKVLSSATDAAQRLGVSSTPSLFISTGDGEPEAMKADTSDAGAVLAEIKSAVDAQ
jgi:protein-disulfide isomerase